MAEQDLLFSQSHEWVAIDGSRATLGISNHAQQELGDIVFVELPDPGSEIQAGAAFGNVESVKAVSELYAPLSGKVIAVNEQLASTPEIVNQDPYGAGWLVKIEISDTSEAVNLMDFAGYQDFLKD